MATPLTQALDDCRKEEGKLSNLLAEDPIKFQQIEQTLNRHRAICSDALLSNFQVAAGPGFKAEDRLWDNHQKINTRFRAALANLRNGPEKKAIELRKLGHEYLKFIKNSQTFYRNLIKRFNQAYGGIPSLERVAKKLSSDLRPNGSISSDPPTSAQLEYCCHRTLIRLGDLSRYRETELSGTEKNWAPANGYYDLALSVCPTSGVPFNQRAVIALAEKSLFQAIYFVYRSLSAEDPHPQGDMNLRRALHKIQQAWNSKELVSDAQATRGSTLPKGMVAWYLRLLEMFYHGKAASEKDELENEVVNQLQVDLEKNPSADTPHKLVVTSIAAQHAAQERFQNKQLATHQNSYVMFLGLNMRLFSTFLRVCVSELTSNMDRSGHGEGEEPTCAVLLSPTMRRALPALRLYGLWLDQTSEIIDSPASGLSDEQKSSFWTFYAESLTRMTLGFPPQGLPDIEHMLEEDEDTIGFRPLYSEKNRTVWYFDGNFKPRWHEVSDDEKRDNTKEMLYRVREFMVRGLELVVARRVPIDFDQELCQFSYHGIGRPVQIEPQIEEGLQETANTDSFSASISDEQNAWLGSDDTQDEAAERMVDDIVGKALDSPIVPNSVSELEPLSSHPATPPPPSIVSFGTASPFPMGSHTVKDVMATAYKPSELSSTYAQAPKMQQSRSSSRPNSRLQSPAARHSLVRASSETSTGSAQNQQPQRQFYPEDPQLPGLGVFSGVSGPNTQLRRSSPAAARSSPLPPPLSHSRGNSTESTRGIWGGGGIFSPSFQPTDARRTSGNMSPGQFGNGTFEPDTMGSSRVPSSLFESGFGQQIGANTPWNHALRENRILSEGRIEGPMTRTAAQPSKMSWSGPSGERSATTWQPT